MKIFSWCAVMVFCAGCSGRTLDPDDTLTCGPGTSPSGGECLPSNGTDPAIAAHCTGTSDVIYFDGDPDDSIHPGVATITQGMWDADVVLEEGTMLPFGVLIDSQPNDPSQGKEWDLNFATPPSVPITPMTYTNAGRPPFEPSGDPGLEISGDDRSCKTISGQFTVEELTMSGDALQSFTASFEQHCEGASAALRGCVHFQQ